MFRAGISKAEAVDVARRAAEANGLAWEEPIRVSRLFGTYYVTANASARGGAIKVTLRASDGAVVSLRVMPR